MKKKDFIFIPFCGVTSGFGQTLSVSLCKVPNNPMSNVKTPVQLYKYLLRQVRLLPKNSQDYYNNYVRQVRYIVTFL